MHAIIEQFNKQAITKKLSGSAILLWQHLYFAMERRGRFHNVPQQPGPLLEGLQISRQGLHQIRQVLIDKGFLTIRVDEYQQTFYTLMMDGKIVGEMGVESQYCPAGNGSQWSATPTANTINEMSTNIQKSNCVGAADLLPPVISIKTTENRDGLRGAQWSAPPTTNAINEAPINIKKLNCVGVADYCDPLAEGQCLIKPHSATDIILTNRYRQYIDAFCQKFGPAPKANLLQWADMRRKNGWTLTLWGLEVVLRNLVELSAGDAMQMANIAAQSVKRRWKGFFALKTKAQPSGEKLLKQEQKQQRNYGYSNRPTQKFAPEGRDLSFLEM